MTNAGPPPIVLLGPQRSIVTAGDVVGRLVPEAPVATVTAGWQEREGEVDELDAVLGGRSYNLALYRRAERVWQNDPELHRAHRKFQRRLRLLRASYNVRLGHLMKSWSALEEMRGDPVVLDPERAAALDVMRQLDEHHLRRIAVLRAEFESQMQTKRRTSIVRERDEIEQGISQSGAVAIAGGHVAVLLNRLRLFALEGLLAQKPLIAWSAGAMVLSDRVVVFHDSPPQGAGNAEVLQAGLGLARDVVLFPHAGERLQLGDPGRVGRMARRFGPARCIALDPAEGIEQRDGVWSPVVAGPVRGARSLDPDGRVRELVA